MAIRGVQFGEVFFGTACDAGEHSALCSTYEVVNSQFVQMPRRAPSNTANAFDELHATQRQLAGMAQPSYDSKGDMVLHYPECTIRAVHNNKDQLHVDLFETFQRNGLGWMSSEHASNLGTPFLNALGRSQSCCGKLQIIGQYWEANIASQTHGGIHSQVAGS